MGIAGSSSVSQIHRLSATRIEVKYDAWYWLNEDTNEWLLVEDEEADWGDDEEEYEDEEECEEA